MFKNKQTAILGILICILIAFGCKSKFEKLREGNDTAKKYKEALRLYNKKDYTRALILFDDLMQRYKGRTEAEDLSFYFAYTNYYLKDYTTARYQFKQFADTYPSSPRSEECRYMTAYCFYLESPKASLDQENTLKAIEALQLFINLYPKSTRVTEASKLIQDLRDKLEKKAFENAKLYYITGAYDPSNYKSAIIAFKNVLRDYPDTKYAEEIEFLELKSQYIYAKNSLEIKQEERFGEAVTMLNDFKEKYTTSKFLKEAEEIRKNSEEGIANAKRILGEVPETKKDKDKNKQDIKTSKNEQ